MKQFVRVAVPALLLAAGAPCALGQDSVAQTPGQNDALSSYDAASQRSRYVVDLVPTTTSWNNPIVLGPIIKASRDIDPLFRTQILGSLAVSPTLAQNTSFPIRSFFQWNTPGAGIHPNFNSTPASSVGVLGFRTQFAVAVSDFSILPSNAIGAVIGRDSSNFNRLYVERVVLAQSRFTNSGADTATISVGSVDSFGIAALRADNFGTLSSTSGRVLGDSILRVNTLTRNTSPNTLSGGTTTNSAFDSAATAFYINNESTPTNVPALIPQGSNSPVAAIYDFASRLRGGATAGVLTTTTTHLPSGATGHRGNPGYSPLNLLGSTDGTVASIATTSTAPAANRLMAFGVNVGLTAPTLGVAAGSQRLFTIPQPITAGSFTANATGQANFRQYLSQTGFRGGVGQVAVGSNSAGNLVLAATATDPTAGSFIPVVVSAGPTATSWTIAAYPGQSVLSGLNGATIGQIPTNASFSAPALDRFGNVYFIASYRPNLAPDTVGLFKAVNSANGYQLELLLSVGQQFTGANSTRAYTISSLTLNDADSIASGSMFSGSIIQDQDPNATSVGATSIRSFGGLVVNAVITYQNGASTEAYDAVLFVGPAQGSDCRADFNNDLNVGVPDIFAFLSAWFGMDPRADIDGNQAIEVADIFGFLSLYFAGCP